MDDITSPNPCSGSSWGFCKRASGEVENEGVELEISGQVKPGWQLTAGYTSVLNEYTKDQNTDNVGQPFAPEYPEHQFKLATNYQHSGSLSLSQRLFPCLFKPILYKPVAIEN